MCTTVLTLNVSSHDMYASSVQNTAINLLRVLSSAATWLIELFYEVYNYSMPIHTQSSYAP